MTRTVLTVAVFLGALAAPAAAIAGAGQSAQYLSTLTAPSSVPIAIRGTYPKAFVLKGQKLGKGQSLMRVKVNGPAHSGIKLRFTCPTGFVTGYGYKGADGMALNGRSLFAHHTTRPKVQAIVDINKDGRFTGTVYAFCEGGH